MKYTSYLIIAGILSTMLTGCYYDNQEELYPADLNPCDTSNATYSNKVQLIINNSCAVSGCHVSNGQSPDLSNYNGLKSNIDNVNMRAVQQKTMPPSGPLNDCDILVLQQWINSGSLNN